MKQKPKNVLAAIAVSCFLLSFGQFAKGQECPCPGALISQNEFDTFTKNYESFFVSGALDKKHTKWIYMPVKYFEVLIDFFNKNPSNDGIWIYFISYGYILDPGQQKSDQQILFNVVASEKRKPKFDDIRNYLGSSGVLNNYKIELSTRHDPVSASRIGVGHIFKRMRADILGDSLRYKLTNPDVKYSERLFVCKTQIQQIVNYVKAKGLGGVKLYFASYGSILPCTQNKDLQQFTLLLAPVKNKFSEPNYEAYNNFLIKRLKFLQTEVYNHGSLCPNDCR